MGREAIVPNINWFMSVPILADVAAGVCKLRKEPNHHVVLLARTDVLAVLSNCLQMHNPCNSYNPTPIKVEIY